MGKEGFGAEIGSDIWSFSHSVCHNTQQTGLDPMSVTSWPCDLAQFLSFRVPLPEESSCCRHMWFSTIPSPPDVSDKQEAVMMVLMQFQQLQKCPLLLSRKGSGE